MKRSLLPFTRPVFLSLFLLLSCNQNPGSPDPDSKNEPRKLPAAFKDYWFAGQAEITSYELRQARYGEYRDGHAVLVYVTEPFRPDQQVKADESHPDNIQVLKLNRVKKFITGIYPYSIMTSIFYPIFNRQHAIKLSTSVQEWCGHVYTQLNNRSAYEIESHSYFEKEGDQKLRLQKIPMEDELWTQLRMDPSELPTGNFQMLPSLEYIRLRHKELKAYAATATLTRDGDLSVYELQYPELERSLRIEFDTAFPFAIDNWSDTYRSGFGPNAKQMTTTAKRIKTLKTAYWQKNGIKDVILRDSLGL